MTFKEFMKEVGYNLMTTFWEDFSIADKYGVSGVKDTYRRAFSEWKDDYKFFTELTLVLNHKIWQHYESNRELAALYDRLWREAVEYLTGPKEYSREQAFNIIREWAKEFTEKYGNYDFDGSYYDEIDEFIDKKLGTI